MVIYGTPVDPKALLQYSPTCPDDSREKFMVPGAVMLKNMEAMCP